MGSKANGSSPRRHHGGAGRRCSGFSLIELLIVLFLMAALFTWGSPDLRRMITNTRLAAISNTLLADLRQTQSHALTNGMAWLCPVATPGQADPQQCGTEWEDGWQVVRREGESGSYTYTPMRLQDPVPRFQDDTPQVTIEANGNIQNGVCFNAMGYPQQLQMGANPSCTGIGTGTFTICRADRTRDTNNGHNEDCRDLVIANTGRMRITEPREEALTP